MASVNNLIFGALIILSSFSTDLSSQDLNRHVLYFDMVQLLSVNNLSFDFGYTLDTENRFAHTFELGIILADNFLLSDEKLGPGRRNGRGFEIRYMPKFHFNQSYIGVETAFVNHSYQSHRFRAIGNEIVYAYDVKQKEFATYLAFGGVIIESGSYIDISLGLGVRFQNVTNNSTVPLNNFSSQRRFSQYIEIEDTGWHRLLGIRFSTKIGFEFPKVF